MLLIQLVQRQLSLDKLFVLMICERVAPNGQTSVTSDYNAGHSGDVFTNIVRILKNRKTPTAYRQTPACCQCGRICYDAQKS